MHRRPRAAATRRRRRGRAGRRPATRPRTRRRGGRSSRAATSQSCTCSACDCIASCSRPTIAGSQTPARSLARQQRVHRVVGAAPRPRARRPQAAPCRRTGRTPTRGAARNRHAASIDGERGRRVVGEVAVPERVPLARAGRSSRASGTARTTRRAPRRGRRAARRRPPDRRACIMPKQSTTTSAGSSPFTGTSPRAPSRLEPRTAVGAGVLRDRCARREVAGGRYRLDCVTSLRHERGRLDRTRFLGKRRVGDELREAARRAQPHLQRIDGVGAGVVGRGEEVRGRLFPEVEDEVTRRAATRTAGKSSHTHALPRRSRRQWRLMLSCASPARAPATHPLSQRCATDCMAPSV